MTVVAYAIMCAIWGTTWLAIKVGLHYIPPITGVGVRFTIAAIVLFAVAGIRREILPLRELPWRLVIVMSTCLFGLNYILTYTAEERLASGLTAVLFGTLPFFTFLYGHYLVNERTTPRIWLGAAIALAGVAVIGLAGEMRGSIPYAFAILGASAVSGFGNVYAKRHSHHQPLSVLPPAMLLTGVVLTIVGSIFEHPDFARAIVPDSIGALLYLAVLGSAITFFINLWLLRRIEVWIVNMSALIIPVIAVFVGVLFGGEHVGLRELLGSGLVIIGMWFAVVRRHEPAIV
jgi:drug/metabolite transporter (DMT)-like permease